MTYRNEFGYFRQIPDAQFADVQPPLVSVSPRAPVPEPVRAPSVATEVSGAFYGPFGFYG
jgi:hypothetical protein